MPAPSADGLPRRFLGVPRTLDPNPFLEGELYAQAKAVGPLATFDADDSWVEHPYKEGVALVGHAAATCDPTFGQGLALTLRSVRLLRDQLLSDEDWDTAGHAYAEAHDRDYQVIHTVEDWLRAMFLETGPEADACRARALPLLAPDGTRTPDLFGLGPETPIGETVRRRFFGEE
jgi:menaquinone-9 beta-reductase